MNKYTLWSGAIYMFIWGFYLSHNADSSYATYMAGANVLLWMGTAKHIEEREKKDGT